MDLPTNLVGEVRQGRAVLFFGAGASNGAEDRHGRNAPGGDQLRDMLADEFLGGQFKNHSLGFVADLAISETSLYRVQDFVADLLRDLQPPEYLQLLPTFRWRGFATTNYDLLIESAYATASRPVQQVAPFLSDDDRVEERLHTRGDLALLKLHGCITRTHDQRLPLILALDQYAEARKNRELLFRIFEDWAYEGTVVFVGHGLQDPDLRAILSDISKFQERRPRYYIVRPGATPEENRFWESKKITVLNGTFEEFLRALDREIPLALRPLLQAVNVDHPIRARFRVNEPVGPMLEDFLSNEVEYVHPAMAIEQGNPGAFYKGFNQGWYPVEHDLDVRRRLTDTVLSEVIIRAEEDRPTVAELYAVKAEAGAGKSVFLRRVAWEASRDADALCIFLREYGVGSYEGIRELFRVTEQRIFLFADDAADRVAALASMIIDARRDELPLTIITAERINAWNMYCERLEQLVAEAFRLRYLSRTEIEVLVDLLARHDSLGPHLEQMSRDGRVQEFEERAGRQLLVALHEATMGAPFQEILLDEFNEIQPQTARSLYLTVCVLNRFRAPVRAGLVARVHEIPFENFKERFFSPLQHVVQVKLNSSTQDYHYAARHPEIAQIVFDRVLRTPADRYNEYVRIVRELNVAYSSDRTAFRGLVRARSLHELFPDYQMVRGIYEIAREVGGEEAFVFQQMANYERIRSDGNYEEAHRFLLKARALDPRDNTIIHTLAELARTRAEHAEKPLERERFRNEARALLTPLTNDPRDAQYARHTLIKITIDYLKDLLEDESATDRAIDDAIRSVEDQLHRGLQQYPRDEYLLTAEAQFSTVLNDHERSFTALRKAFEANARDPYISSRLARLYEERGDLAGAERTLHAALEGNRADKQLNYRYGTVLRLLGTSDADRLAYYFRRGYTPGDRNYEAQFWYARYAFELSDEQKREDSRQIFRVLRGVGMAHASRIEIRDRIIENGRQAVFRGTVTKLDEAHGFVQRDGLGDYIFMHADNTEPTAWASLRLRGRVAFAVGFTFGGVRALEVQAA